LSTDMYLHGNGGFQSQNYSEIGKLKEGNVEEFSHKFILKLGN
jgi:hypothetical protein